MLVMIRRMMRSFEQLKTGIAWMFMAISGVLKVMDTSDTPGLDGRSPALRLLALGDVCWTIWNAITGDVTPNSLVSRCHEFSPLPCPPSLSLVFSLVGSHIHVSLLRNHPRSHLC